MKSFIRVMMIIVSMFFVVSLCSQVWARPPMVKQENKEQEPVAIPKEPIKKEPLKVPKVPQKVVKCGKKTATIVGTEGNDTLDGGEGTSDNCEGGDGEDTVINCEGIY